MVGPTLYHYTCHHGQAALLSAGMVAPPAQFMTPRQTAPLGALFTVLTKLAWFTDLDEPVADVLGLTSRMIYCDRTQYRWQVDAPPGDVRGLLPVPYGSIRRRLNVFIRDSLELSPGAEPAHWWVATWPVPVTYAPAHVGGRQGVWQ